MPGLYAQAGALLSGAGSLALQPAVTKTVMDDFEDGDLAEWDRVDSPWSAQTTYAYEGSYGAHADNTTTGTVAMHALEGSLDADFAPGQVYHFAFREVGGSDTINAYFAKQDTTLGTNWYRLQLRIEAGNGGFDVAKDESGAVTEFYDDGAVTGLPSGTAWGHAYIYWDPAELADDPDNATTPTNGTGADGDFYIEIQDDNGVPKLSKYVNADDLTYRGGGVGYLLTDGNNFAVDLLESGDVGAFPEFDPTAHLPGANEIAYFEHGDKTAWDNTLQDIYEVVGSGTVPTQQGDYCLMKPVGTSGAEAVSIPGAGATGQEKDLPNYLPEGSRGRVFARTNDAANDEVYIGCAVADTNNYLRAELDWSQDRFRVLEWVNGNLNSYTSDTSMTWQSGTWYELIMDRTTAGEVTFDVNTAGGSNVSTVVWNTDSSLDANEGVLIGGTSGTGTQFYDGFELF